MRISVLCFVNDQMEDQELFFTLDHFEIQYQHLLFFNPVTNESDFPSI